MVKSSKPAEAVVRGAAEELIRQCTADGRTPTVAELAEQVGVGRSALYALYPDVVQVIRDHRAEAGLSSTGRPRDERAQAAELRARKVQREASALKAELAAYAEQIRFLTEENARLRRELNQRAQVPELRGRHRTSDSSSNQP
jgi:hypothetical protein